MLPGGPDPVENAHTSVLIPHPQGFSDSHGAAIFTPISQPGKPRLREVTDFSEAAQQQEQNRDQHTGKLPPRPEPFPLRAKRKQTSHDSGFHFWGVTLAYNTPRKCQGPFENLKNIKETLPRTNAHFYKMQFHEVTSF